MADYPDQNISEEQLVNGLSSHDLDALDKLYDRYAATLFGAIVRVLKNEKEAEKVLVDSFTEVWQKAPDQYPAGKPFFQWLAGTCQTLALNKAESHTGKAGSHHPNFFNLADLIEFAIQPRHKVKEKLMRRLHKMEKQKQAALASNQNRPVFVAPEIHFNHKKRDKYQWLLAACFTLLILSNILSFYFYQRWKRTQNQLADAETEQVRLTRNVNKAQEKIAQLQTSVVVLEDEQMHRIQLKGQARSVGSLAVVHYNPKTSQVFLELKQLPLPPDKFQYQLWALDKRGKPVNAGLVDTATSLEGMLLMKKISQSRTFMLTLEPSGGSPEPTLDQIYLMGKF